MVCDQDTLYSQDTVVCDQDICNQDATYSRDTVVCNQDTGL